MIYELRLYTIEHGTKELMHQLFEEEIAPLFRKVGMATIGFWEPLAGSEAGDVEFVYLLGFESAAQRERAWADFLAHPEWLAVKGQGRHAAALEESRKVYPAVAALFAGCATLSSASCYWETCCLASSHCAQP